MDGSLMGPLTPSGPSRSGIDSWMEGIRRASPFLRHIAWRMEEARLYTQAHQSTVRADWFCSLPWYRQWWALVTRR